MGTVRHRLRHRIHKGWFALWVIEYINPQKEGRPMTPLRIPVIGAR